MMIFTTLFDSYYLDKGLCMYRSLKKVTDDFKLYIFCFDDRSKEILEKECLEKAVMLSHKDLERKYPELLELKEERSKAEYCWTCTPATIEYVLEECHEDNCTYIDSDLYFFRDPKVLFDEVDATDKHTIITPHRFSDSLKDRHFLKRSGKYCVEFNYFDQSPESRIALRWWRDKCFEWCYHIYEKDRMGDQKYIEKFPSMFKGVVELQNKGGGVAPWNLKQYELVNTESGMPYKTKEELEFLKDKIYLTLRDKKEKDKFDLIFYHFQNIRYLSETKVNISSETHDKNLKRAIYIPYLRDIESTRKMLKEKYDISFSVKNIHASNKLIAFLQGTLLRFKIKSLSDIIDLNNL